MENEKNKIPQSCNIDSVIKWKTIWCSTTKLDKETVVKLSDGTVTTLERYNNFYVKNDKYLYVWLISV